MLSDRLTKMPNKNNLDNLWLVANRYESVQNLQLHNSFRSDLSNCVATLSLASFCLLTCRFWKLQFVLSMRVRGPSRYTEHEKSRDLLGGREKTERKTGERRWKKREKKKKIEERTEIE